MLTKRNKEWQELIEKEIKQSSKFENSEVIEYLEKWIFLNFYYEDAFEEIDGEEVHTGIRMWEVEFEGKVIEFKKEENYTYEDIPEKWIMNESIDFEEYLIDTFDITGYQLGDVLYVIDKMIQDM